MLKKLIRSLDKYWLSFLSIIRPVLGFIEEHIHLRHFYYAFGAGVVTRLFLVLLDLLGVTANNLPMQEALAITCMAFWFLVTLAVEANQYDNAWAKNGYLKRKYLDIIFDMLLGNAGFAIPMLVWNPLLRG